VNYHKFKAVSESPDEGRIALLERLFASFLVSLSFAKKLDSTYTFIREDEEIRQRELLAVEQRRKEERDRVEASRRYQREQMSVELHERVYEQIMQTIDNPEYILARVLYIQTNSIALLDAVNARAVSLNKLEDLASGLNWLQEGLIRVVNMPPFADPKDPKRVKVTSLRNAMSFVGTEDLKILIPAFTMQNWIPKIMEPFTLLRRKLWEHSLGTAITAQVLAELDGTVDPVHAYVAGMFHDIGKAIITRLYSMCFDDVQRDMLRELRDEVRSERYNALIELMPSELFLRNLMVQFERKISANLINSLDLKYLPTRTVHEEFANAEEVEGLSGLARILFQANRYSEFRMMHAANLVTTEDGKLMCKEAQLGRHELEVLRTVNLRRLRLSRGTAEE